MLSVDENMFEQTDWKAFSGTIGLQGPRGNWLAIVRYVDDVFVATRWLFPGCIEHLVAVNYSGTVLFDAANDGLTEINAYSTAKSLDFWCYMFWHRQFFALVNKNDLL